MKLKICFRPGGVSKLKASPTEGDWKINAYRQTVNDFVVDVAISTFRHVLFHVYVAHIPEDNRLSEVHK